MSKDRGLVYQWLNALAFLITVAVNALANILSLGGVTTGEVSQAYPNLFTPTEATFVIWGLIYLLLAGFALYQAGILKPGDGGLPPVEALGGWFIASCAFNIAWLFAWHFDLIALSVVMMLGLLYTLIVLWRKTRTKTASGLEKLLWQAPFSVYFGWITVATIANISALLVKLGWNGWGLTSEIWTMIVLIAGLLIACAVILPNRDWIYGLTVIWAYAGILFKHISQSGFASAYPLIIAVAALCEAVLIASCIASAFKPSR